MPSPFELFVNAELPRRISTEVPVSGNLDAGKIPRSTGVGLGVEFVDPSSLVVASTAPLSISLVNGDTAALSKGQLVYIAANGQALLASRLAADNAVVIKGVVRAIALENVAVAASGQFAVMGLVSLTTSEWDAVTGESGGLVAGQNYHLGGTAGGLSHDIEVSPLAEGDIYLEVGFAVSPTQLLFKPAQVLVF